MSERITTQRLHELFRHLPPPPQCAGEHRRLVVQEDVPVRIRHQDDVPSYERVKLCDVGIVSVAVDVEGGRKYVWAIHDVVIIPTPHTELIDREGLRMLAVAAKMLTTPREDDAAHRGQNFAMTTFKPVADMLRTLSRHGMFNIETDSDLGVGGFWP